MPPQCLLLCQDSPEGTALNTAFNMPRSCLTQVSLLLHLSSWFLLPATQEPGLINQDCLLGFTPSAKEPAVLPSAAGQGQLVNISGGGVSGQGIWGQPTPAKAAIFPPGKEIHQEQEGKPRMDISGCQPRGGLLLELWLEQSFVLTPIFCIAGSLAFLASRPL